MIAVLLQSLLDSSAVMFLAWVELHVNKTNMLAGKLFKAAGILAMLGAAFPEHAILFILASVILAGIYSIIYSYQEYRREIGVSQNRRTIE